MVCTIFFFSYGLRHFLVHFVKRAHEIIVSSCRIDWKTINSLNDHMRRSNHYMSENYLKLFFSCLAIAIGIKWNQYMYRLSIEWMEWVLIMLTAKWCEEKCFVTFEMIERMAFAINCVEKKNVARTFLLCLQKQNRERLKLENFVFFFNFAATAHLHRSSSRCEVSKCPVNRMQFHTTQKTLVNAQNTHTQNVIQYKQTDTQTHTRHV